uniref:Ig-like domain-containing protein n=1 Tax=Lates calcarifer TaxID=8187 RepID=A0A4W6EKA1_LATCA
VGPYFPSALINKHVDFFPGQSQLIGPSQPIVATVGDDVILPCHLDPAEDVGTMILEWTRPDLKPIYVHMRRAGQDLVDKHPSYKGRTSLFINELKHGNISLKLSKVKLSDGGTYHCFIPKLDKRSSVELVVGAASSPVISLSGTDSNRGAVVLECESKGWYPEPEVLWLDGEGNLLSAGPTETVRGPDDLYTVSSRVTVEKRHSNSFTSEVQRHLISNLCVVFFFHFKWRIISTQKLQEQQRRTQSLEEELQRRTQSLEQELQTKKEEVCICTFHKTFSLQPSICFQFLFKAVSMMVL